ncbi:tRNA (guanosine(37)-N1)-methyltransferase TrmD [candidate division KSB1 bacterium]|nr:tRNA (guanosine(37)-N1)-methyltransferase TrmD [candidate division KSB1 bacterium]
MKILVVTAFPNLVRGPLDESIIKRAVKKKIVSIKILDLRDFTIDKHKQVDDYPYGGGAGMILKPEPFFRAVEHIKAQEVLENPRVILMTPQGKSYTQDRAKSLARESDLIFLCGHYKGIDERVREYLVTEEISIGDYVLTGGELAAAVVIDSVVRLLPGAIGDFDSALSDSFENGLLDCPYYTRPEGYRGMKVPQILLSGHHAEIEKWRKDKSLERTEIRRADLLGNIVKSIDQT